MTPPDRSAIVSAWDAYHRAHDQVLPFKTRREVGRDLAVDVVVFAADPDDPSSRTTLVTAGLSRIDYRSDVGPFELSVAVRGALTPEETAALARELVELAFVPLRHDFVMRPDVMIEYPLPVFVDRAAVLVTDAGWSTPEHLPGLRPRVRVLELRTLYAGELAQIARLGTAEARQQFLDAGVDLIARDRPPVDLERPEPPPRRALVRSRAMANKPGSGADPTASWVEIETWLAKHAPKTFERLNPPVDPATLASVEETLGKRLPDDVRRSYERHDGYVGLGEYEYMSLEVALEMWESQEGKKGKVPKKSAHQGKIKKVGWHAGWFPIAMDSAGNFLCVDLEPEAEGTFGQIVFWEVEEGPFASDLDGWAAWLAKFVDELRSGKLVGDEEGRLKRLTL